MDKGAIISSFVVTMSRFGGSGLPVSYGSILFFHSFCIVVIIAIGEVNFSVVLIRLSRLFNELSWRLLFWLITIWFWSCHIIDSDNNNKIDLFKIILLFYIYNYKLIDTRNRSCFSWYCFPIPDKSPPAGLRRTQGRVFLDAEMRTEDLGYLMSSESSRESERLKSYSHAKKVATI